MVLNDCHTILHFQVEDVVELLGEVEDGWWRGMVNGKAGVFPSNFVEMLNNTDAAAVSNAAAAKNKMMTVGNAAPLSEPQKASRVETKNKRNENLKGTCR